MDLERSRALSFPSGDTFITWGRVHHRASPPRSWPTLEAACHRGSLPQPLPVLPSFVFSCSANKSSEDLGQDRSTHLEVFPSRSPEAAKGRPLFLSQWPLVQDFSSECF